MWCICVWINFCGLNFAVELRDGDDGKFVDVGNLYFYGRSPMTHADANATCTNNRMRLVEVGDVEEMGVVVDGVSQFQSELEF